MIRLPQSRLSPKEDAGQGYYSAHESDELVTREKGLIGEQQAPLLAADQPERSRA